MEAFDGTTIFWLFAVGLLAGGLIKLTIWKQGVGLIPNLIFGVLGAIIVGAISVILQLPGSLLFAFLGTMTILFLLNVFFLQPEEIH